MGDSYGRHHSVSRLMIVRQWRRHGVDWTGVDMSTQLLLEVAVVKLQAKFTLLIHFLSYTTLIVHAIVDDSFCFLKDISQMPGV